MTDSIALGAHTPGTTKQIRTSSIGESLVRARRVTRFLDATARPVLDLATRFWLAQLFFVSGFIKLTNWDTALFLAENEYPVSWLDPVAAAQIGVAIEIGGAVLLAIGFMTRPAAIALIALTVISQFVYVQLNAHVYWVLLLGWFAIMGAGSLSFDRLLLRGVTGSALPGAGAIAGAYSILTRYAGPGFQLTLRLMVAAVLVIGGLGAIGDLEGGPVTLNFLFSDDLIPASTPALVAVLLTAIIPLLIAFGLATRAAAVDRPYSDIWCCHGGGNEHRRLRRPRILRCYPRFDCDARRWRAFPRLPGNGHPAGSVSSAR